MKVAGKNIGSHSPEFRKHFDRLFPAMCILATRILKDEVKAKDIAQEAFIKLWQKEEEEFADENALKAYLYVLTKNACISLIRKESKMQLSNIDEHSEIPSDQKILNEILREETYGMLNHAISNLSPQAEEVVKLALKGFSNPEVAEKLGVSINTIKTVKKRAYKSLRENLGPQFVMILLTQLISFFD